MLIRRKKSDSGGIPTASLSDVAFLLLVFFLSTTKFDIKKGLGLMLPAPSSEEAEKKKLNPDNLTKISINKDGLIEIKIAKNDPKKINLNDIEPTVRKLVNDNAEMVFSLKTDRKSKY